MAVDALVWIEGNFLTAPIFQRGESQKTGAKVGIGEVGETGEAPFQSGLFYKITFLKTIQGQDWHVFIKGSFESPCMTDNFWDEKGDKA